MSNRSSHRIMFIAVISISTLVVAVFSEQIDSTTSSISTQQNWLSNQLKTDITIEVINFVNGSENQTTVYLENTGSTILDIGYIDVYVGGKRIPRNDSNRSIRVLSDTEIKNTGEWDPKEQVEIVFNTTLKENSTYTLLVTGQYGARDTEDFST